MTIDKTKKTIIDDAFRCVNELEEVALLIAVDKETEEARCFIGSHDKHDLAFLAMVTEKALNTALDDYEKEEREGEE